MGDAYDDMDAGRIPTAAEELRRVRAERDRLAAEVERLQGTITAERMYAAFWKAGGQWSWNDAVRLAAALAEESPDE